MLKNLCQHSSPTNELDFVARTFCVLLSNSYLIIGSEQQKVAIRILTFHALRMTHTCCGQCPNDYNHCDYTQEEALEIQQLESGEREILDDLVIEFCRNLESRLAISSAHLETQVDFWLYHWTSRMREVLEKLHSIDDPEQHIKDTESMGVIWDDTETEERLTRFDYWVHEIDKVMQTVRKTG